MSDEHDTLVERASRGESPAVDELLARHLPSLHAFVRRRIGGLVGDRESSSDIAQSVCREVLQGIGGFDYRGEAAFRAWLFENALGKIRDRARYYRAQKRDVAREVHRGSQDEVAALGSIYRTMITPSRVALGREALQQFEADFAELPEEQREVVLLARVVGLGRREIAERLGRSEDSVRGLLQRGVTRLSWALSRYHGDR